ncbi:MAG: hypothetical protein ABIZ09_08185 [Rhodoferax sp.]
MTAPEVGHLKSRHTLLLFAVSLATVALLFVWQGHQDFNLWDEGFFWYGAKRVLAGDVPIRDFLAYDPARYYWAAALMRLIDSNGIVALRAATAVCQVLALFLALCTVMRHGKVATREKLVFVVASAITLVMWMYVYCKVYDVAASIVLIAAFAFVIERSSQARYFWLGVCVGLMASIGRNHGVYGLVGCAGLVVLNGLGTRVGFFQWFKPVPTFVAGVVLGFAPILLMMLLVDGFASAFMDSVYFLFEMKATNLPLPVPWPWSPELLSMPLQFAVHGFLVGFVFIGVVLLPLVSLPWLAWQRYKGRGMNPAFAAAALLSLPYAHYVFSRADVPHLSFGVFPLLVASLVALQGLQPKLKWTLLAGLVAGSIALMFPLQPAGKCLLVHKCVTLQVAGDTLNVPEQKAKEVEWLKKLAAEHLSQDGNILVTPSWPGAYALLNKRAPVLDIYALLKRSTAFQEQEIVRIAAAKPELVVIVNEPLDGGDAHSLENTNPLIYQYVLTHFVGIPSGNFEAAKAYTPK